MLLSPAPFLTDHLPLTQSPAYAATLELLGVPHWSISDDDCAHMLVMARTFGPLQLSATMSGPVWQTTDRTAQVDFLRASNLHLINADGATAAGTLRRAGFIRVMTPAHVAVLDLMQDLAAAMAPKWRNAWRQSQTKAVKIKASRFDPTRDAWLLALEDAQQLAARYQGYPRAFHEALAAANPNDVHIYSAVQDGQPIAAMLFVTHAPTVTYQVGWTSPEGRGRKSHHHLLIRAAQDFAAQGYLTMDLGQIDTQRAPGLARFKWGSGARIIATGGTWLRPFGLLRGV